VKIHGYILTSSGLNQCLTQHEQDRKRYVRALLSWDTASWQGGLRDAYPGIRRLCSAPGQCALVVLGGVRAWDGMVMDVAGVLDDRIACQ
jgi:hypothetical protein